MKRELKTMEVFTMASGAMISSGLFVLPGLAYAQAGPAVVLSYGIAAIAMLPAMLSIAELATAMPKAGGNYLFIERSLGSFAGIFMGFADWFAIAMKSAFALVGIGALASAFLPANDLPVVKTVALVACVLFAVLNTMSVKGTGRFQNVFVFVLLGLLAGYIAWSANDVRLDSFRPVMPHGVGAVFATAGMVFVSFGGLTKVAAASGEVMSPGTSIPAGMFRSFFVVSTLYVVTVTIIVGTVEHAELSATLVPFNLSAVTTMGRTGELVVSAAAMLAFITTANAGILAASRIPVAMAEDGIVPEVLARNHRRFHTPHVAILCTTVFIMAIIVLLSIEDLVKTASTMLLIGFFLVNASVVVMRTSGIESYRPAFKAPWFPLPQIAGMAAYAVLIAQMGSWPLQMTLFFALFAIIWYVVYVRRRIVRESAAVYLVRNALERSLGRSGLEDELQAMAIERTGIERDRFDLLVRSCTVIDIEEQCTAREMFERIAREMAPHVGMEPEQLTARFLAREAESSTVVQQGLAIPHVIVDQPGSFDVCLLRCKKGVVFSELQPPVTAVFALIGSRDERSYHLKALLAIAHVVQSEGFKDRWMRAKNAEQLRDIVLLADRPRQPTE